MGAAMWCGQPTQVGSRVLLAPDAHRRRCRVASQHAVRQHRTCAKVSTWYAYNPVRVVLPMRTSSPASMIAGGTRSVAASTAVTASGIVTMPHSRRTQAKQRHP